MQGGERKRVTKQPSIPEDTSSESDETEDQENRGRIQEKENRRFVHNTIVHVSCASLLIYNLMSSDNFFAFK